MNRRTIVPALLLIVTAVSINTACSPSAVTLYNSKWVPVQHETYTDRAWADVLKTSVNNGLVDYKTLAKDPGRLYEYLGLISVIGPRTNPKEFPTPNDHVAYYINVYNAGVLAAVLQRRIPETMHDIRQIPLESGFRFNVDGSRMTLYEIHKQIRKESPNDIRFEFALCQANLGSPPLMNRPYRGESLKQTYEQIARYAMNQPNMVQINHQDHLLLVWNGLFSNQSAFTDYYNRMAGVRNGTLLNVLMSFAGGMRREWLNTAQDYEIGAIPYDRRLNQVNTGS